MSEYPKPPDRRMLTVLIRNDVPLIHLNDSPTFRSVHIELTQEQLAKLTLKHKDEDIGSCFLERPHA